jgi:hypothetical protein
MSDVLSIALAIINTILLLAIVGALAWIAIALTEIVDRLEKQLYTISEYLSCINTYLRILAHWTEHPPQRETPRPPDTYTVG